MLYHGASTVVVLWFSHIYYGTELPYSYTIPYLLSKNILVMPWYFLSAFMYLRIISAERVLRSVFKSSGCSSQRLQRVVYLEHVIVRVTITHPHRGDLSITLTSPAGTRSQLLTNRYKYTEPVQMGWN